MANTRRLRVWWNDLCVGELSTARSQMRFVDEGVGWGLPRTEAQRVIVDLVDRAPAALQMAALATPEAPRELLDLLSRRIKALLAPE